MSRPPFVSIHIQSPAPGRRVAAADIVEAYAREIRGGRIPAGCRLPPVRVLERQLGLSKNTAQAAYDELAARGLLDARPREGVFVAAAEGVTLAAPPVAEPPLPALKPVPTLFTSPPPDGCLRLSSVFIDPDLLPREALIDCFRSVLRQPGLEPYYDHQGYRPLRVAIAQRLGRRGMEVDPDQVIITVGSQQAIDIVSRSLTVGRMATEDPVYPGGPGAAGAQRDRTGAAAAGSVRRAGPRCVGGDHRPPAARACSTPSPASRTPPGTRTPATSWRPCWRWRGGTGWRCWRTTGDRTCCPTANTGRRCGCWAGPTCCT